MPILSGNRSVAVLCEAVRTLDAERDGNTIASVRTDGITIFELADRYDAAFTLDEAQRRELRRRTRRLRRDRRRRTTAVCLNGSPFYLASPALLHRFGADAFRRRRRAVHDGRPQTLRRPGRAHRLGHQYSKRAAAGAAQRDRARTRRQGGRRDSASATSRSYAKSIAALQRYIESLPDEGELPSLSAVGRRAHGRSERQRPRDARFRPPPMSKRDAFKQEVHAALLAAARPRHGQQRAQRRGQARRAAFEDRKHRRLDGRRAQVRRIGRRAGIAPARDR